jgi:hypothetical protein
LVPSNTTLSLVVPLYVALLLLVNPYPDGIDVPNAPSPNAYLTMRAFNAFNSLGAPVTSHVAISALKPAHPSNALANEVTPLVSHEPIEP